MFLGFANYYRRFIAGYSKITQPMTSLLKGSIYGIKKGELDWPPEANEAFKTLKKAFIIA